MSNGLILVPFIAAFFGWFAGKMAVKLLFHPALPVRILGFTIQGVLPGKKDELARKLGNLVATELGTLSGGLGQKIADPENFKKIMPFVEGHIDQFLRVRLVEKMPVIGMLIGEKTILDMKAIFTQELETLFPVIMNNYMNSLQTGVELEATIITRIQRISLAGLENSLNTILSKELRHLSILGAVAGFIIGLIQFFVVILL